MSAQNTTKSLQEVLEILEERYNTSFSYLDSDIANIKVSEPSSSMLFRESVTYLKSRTPLNYTFINDKQVAISAQKEAKYFCGVLVDKQNNMLFGATITSDTETVISQEDGFFKVTYNASDSAIIIKYTGYRDTRKKIDRTQDFPCQAIVLQENVQSLNEIILTNYIAKGIDRQSDGAININFSEMEILPGQIESDVLLTAQALPGIQSVNERVSDLNIRGGTHDQNLILWDGIKMYQSGHFFGLISSVNPNITEEVVLYKNGTPARLTDGVSGTLELKSSQKINDSIKASIEANLINTGGYADLPLSKKSSLQVSARKSLSDVIETPTYTEYFNRVFQDTEVVGNGNNTTAVTDDELFSFYDTSLRWLYQPGPKDRIQVNGLVVNNEISFRESAIINEVRERQRSSASQNNLAGGIGYDRKWNEKLSTFAQVYGSSYTLNATNVDIVNSQRLKQQNDVLENGFRVEATLRPKSGRSWQGGYHFIETGVTNVQDVNNPLFRQSVKEVVRSHSVFASYDRASFNGKSRLVLGLRGQYYDKFDTYRLEPRLHFTQNLSPGWSVAVDAEMKSQNTSQVIDFQSDFLGIESRRWQLSNGTTVPLIRSKQASLGLAYNRNKWLISAEGYIKEVDGITIQSQGFQNQLQFIRGSGSYMTSGIDFLLHKRWDRFNFRTGYTYAVNNYTFEELPANINAEFPNNVDIRHSIKAALGYSRDHFKFAAGINWHSGRPTTILDSSTPIINGGLNYQTPNSKNLSGYIRLDVSAQYTFGIGKNSKGELGLSVWNVLNNENTLNQYFLVSESRPTTIREKALNLTPNISFKIRYN